jgi:hypothetical protein
MLYFFPASWTLKWHRDRGERDTLRLDKQFIAGAKMYPRPGHGLHGNGAHGQCQDPYPASIGKVGEEDLFRFTAASDGGYVIDTRGPTDVGMKLFGPDSETALIAEDDDSGTLPTRGSRSS